MYIYIYIYICIHIKISTYIYIYIYIYSLHESVYRWRRGGQLRTLFGAAAFGRTCMTILLLLLLIIIIIIMIIMIIIIILIIIMIITIILILIILRRRLTRTFRSSAKPKEHESVSKSLKVGASRHRGVITRPSKCMRRTHV